MAEKVKEQKRGNFLKGIIIAVVALAAAVFIPQFLNGITGGGYYLHLLIIIAIFSILSMSYNVITGVAGQSNLAHIAFMGTGAYISTILVMYAGVNYWITFFLAGIVAMLLGLLIGIPTLKMRGTYFAIGTLAISQLMSLIWLNGMPGGSDGIPDVPHIPLWGIDFTQKINYAYLMIFFAAVTFFVVLRVVKSRTGRAFVSIREGEDLALTTGINTTQYKLTAFMISAFFGGIAGALYAPYMHYICPQDFSMANFMTVLTMLAVGGFGTIWGPILGTTILTILPEVLLPLKDYIFIVYGAILIPVIIYAPRGIMGAVEDMRARRQARRAKRAEV
ncbi:MAG: branched-chain amino acid ABC transporter permease [Dehalococcoidales bacterium]|nr:branched-chain amino acid ABC transporter permease [Dehalococcoidales bacterium]